MIQTKGLAPKKNNAPEHSGAGTNEISQFNCNTPPDSVQPAPAQIADPEPTPKKYVVKFPYTDVNNLPTELLSQKRFIPSCIDAETRAKRPVDKIFCKRENYATPADALDSAKNYDRTYGTGNAFAALDICGYNTDVGFVSFDFDNVLDDSGQFLNQDAEKWFNYLLQTLDCYAEFSASGRGIHILGKLPADTHFGDMHNVTLYFSKEPESKLEVSFKKRTRKTLHMTGKPFRTTSKNIGVFDATAEALDFFLATVKPPTKARTNKSARPTEFDDNPDISALKATINHLSADDLVAKGYLREADHGGFICPWCGSGTHEHKSGALVYYPADNETAAQVHCFSRYCHGDIIGFLAQIYGIPDSGKDFFALLKKAADDFAIPYDAKIFERKSPAPDYSALFEGLKPIRLSAGAILNVADPDTKPILTEFFSGNFAAGVQKLTAMETANNRGDSTMNTTPALSTEQQSISWIAGKIYPYFADNVPAFKPFLLSVLRRANAPFIPEADLDAAIEQTKSTFSGKPFDFAARFKAQLIAFAQHSADVFQSMLKFDFPRVEKFLADEFTDLVVGELIVDVQGDNLRFDVDQASWYIWRKNHWHAVEVKSLAPLYDLWTPLARKSRVFADFERLRAYCELLDFTISHPGCEEKKSQNHEQFKRLKSATNAADVKFKETAALEVSRNMGAFFEQASGLPQIHTETKRFDKNLFLLNCANCTYNLNTNSNYSARREDLITLETGTDYDPNATCEAWEKFIGEAIPDDELRDWVQRFFGYSLSGSTDEDIFVFIHGIGGGGKTTFLNAIKTALGNYAATFPVDLITANGRPKDGNEPSPALASLRGRRLACSSETERGRRLDEAKIKLLTGGAEITARHLHKPIFSYRPEFKLVIDGNYLLGVGDVNDRGLRRRLRIVPFTNPPSPDKVDTALEQKLTTPTARSAILNWLLVGWKNYQQRGLRDTPRTISAAQQSFYEANDVISDFLADVDYAFDTDAKTTAKELWQAYGDWRRRTPKAPAFNRADFISAVELATKDDGVTLREIHHQKTFVGFYFDPTNTTPNPF